MTEQQARTIIVDMFTNGDFTNEQHEAINVIFGQLEELAKHRAEKGSAERMRLVNVDAVIKAVDRHTKDESEIVLDNDITCILEEVPTAYDVDAVVEQLEEQRDIFRTVDWNMAMIKATEIVRKGGVE